MSLLRNPTVRRVSLNVAALGIERFARLLVVLLVTAAVGRHLGVEQFGLYSAIFSLCTLFALSADLGIGRVVVRDLVTGDHQPGTLLGTAVAMRLGASFLLGAIAVGTVALSFPGRGPDPFLLGLCFALGYFFRASDAVDLGFQAVTQGHYPAFGRMISLVLGAGFQWWLIQKGAGIRAFAGAFALEGLLMALILAFVWIRFGPQPFRQWKIQPATGQRVLAESWPMFVAFLYTQVYFRIDILLLEKMTGSAQAGLYSASSRIYDILIGVLPLLSVSLFPTLTHWYREDRQAFTRRYTQLTKWITWAGAAGLLLIWFLRHHIVRLIFGPDFAGAANILPWHLASALIMYHCLFRAAYLTLAQRQIVLLWTSLLGAIVNVALNLVLIPKLGAQGAAIAGTLTQIVAHILSNALSHDTRWILKVSARTLLLPMRRFSCP